MMKNVYKMNPEELSAYKLRLYEIKDQLSGLAMDLEIGIKEVNHILRCRLDELKELEKQAKIDRESGNSDNTLYLH